MGNRSFTLDRIRDKLRESGSNIVFLQEVIGENEKHRRSINDWPETNQFEFLADSVWDHYAYGRNAIYQHGHHGNAILSELPFSNFTNIDVSNLPFSQRGVLHGQLQNDVHLLCVHFGLFEHERRKQVRNLVNYINEEVPTEDALILAGDFNDWRKSAHRELKQQCALKEVHEEINKRPAATFPAMTPFLPMDRIYVRGFSIGEVSVLTTEPWRELSDHCALMADLRIDDSLPE
ncbi:MAG: endonuclease/exonuclease/phosphatase family protein [Pseudomonadales bacterium]|nr:endonuclease/exonuclease/phosphatase family protein [Pseudomonadales bacterium]